MSARPHVTVGYDSIADPTVFGPSTIPTGRGGIENKHSTDVG